MTARRRSSRHTKTTARSVNRVFPYSSALDMSRTKSSGREWMSRGLTNASQIGLPHFRGGVDDGADTQRGADVRLASGESIGCRGTGVGWYPNEVSVLKLACINSVAVE